MEVENICGGLPRCRCLKRVLASVEVLQTSAEIVEVQTTEEMIDLCRGYQVHTSKTFADLRGDLHVQIPEADTDLCGVTDSKA